MTPVGDKIHPNLVDHSSGVAFEIHQSQGSLMPVEKIASSSALGPGAHCGHGVGNRASRSSTSSYFSLGMETDPGHKLCLADVRLQIDLYGNLEGVEFLCDWAIYADEELASVIREMNMVSFAGDGEGKGRVYELTFGYPDLDVKV